MLPLVDLDIWQYAFYTRHGNAVTNGISTKKATKRLVWSCNNLKLWSPGNPQKFIVECLVKLDSHELPDSLRIFRWRPSHPQVQLQIKNLGAAGDRETKSTVLGANWSEYSSWYALRP